MAVKNLLSELEIKKLQSALQKDERPEVRQRALMFLLQNDGKNHQEIADFIGCSRGTVGLQVVQRFSSRFVKFRGQKKEKKSPKSHRILYKFIIRCHR